jgi:hypothetical protein
MPQTVVLQQKYANRIYNTSHLILSQVYVAYHHKLFYCGLMAFAVYLTSLNYWRYPVKGWRRNLDMVTAGLALTFHIAIAIQNSAPISYLILVGMGLFAYSLARRSTCQNDSSKLHCLMHLFGNLSNLVLYTHLGSL